MLPPKSPAQKLRASCRIALAAILAASSVAAVALVAPTPAMAQDDSDGPREEVDLDTFYRELAPYGRWFEHRRHGYVWSPAVDDGWRPYTRGHWANTEEYGWYWVAEEEWGWAPFHYGRWAFDENDGWYWIPGTTWGPAWVAWRHNDDHVGWAPLPPDADWEPDGRLRFYSSNYDSPRFNYAWCFVPLAVMAAPGLYHHIVGRPQVASLIRNTRPVNGYSLVNRRVVNRGIDLAHVERFGGKPVPKISLNFTNDPRKSGWRHMPQQTVVPVYRPRVVSRIETLPPQVLPRDPGRALGGFGAGRGAPNASPSARSIPVPVTIQQQPSPTPQPQATRPSFGAQRPVVSAPVAPPPPPSPTPRTVISAPPAAPLPPPRPAIAAPAPRPQQAPAAQPSQQTRAANPAASGKQPPPGDKRPRNPDGSLATPK